MDKPQHAPPLTAGHGHTLPPALSGQRVHLDSAAGGLACYRSQGTSGRPLLLVHSVNAAASAAEVRPLFDHYAAQRPVFALDLPGFGASDRSERDYTPRLMTDAVLAICDEIQRLHGPVPIDGLAVSLGTEFLARAATERPQAFRSLALVSPTGLMRRDKLRGAPCGSRQSRVMRRLLNAPLWREGLFRLLTRPGVVRYFLQRTWGSKAIDEPLLAYDLVSARQPGAFHAPLAFLSFQPFSTDARTVYDAVVQPVWLAHGVRGDFTDFKGAQPLLAGGRWRASVFDTGAMPYFEQTEAFIGQYQQFLQSLD